jgi:mannose-6-phosphate isomerase class I
MAKEPVVLMRIPIDTNCGVAGCHKKIAFGTYAWYCPDSNETICILCGTKRGWTYKERVKQILKKLELEEDISALKKQRKMEIETLKFVREEIDLHNLGKNDLELEKRIMTLTNRAQEYLEKLATSEEKEMFKRFLVWLSLE